MKYNVQIPIFWGTSFADTPSLRQRVITSNKISIIFFLLSLLLEFSYILLYEFNILAVAIIFAGFIGLLPVFLNKLGLIYFSRYWLSISVPSVILITSLYTKVLYQTSLSHEHDYFNYRIVIMAVSIIPALLFRLNETKSMLICITVSITYIVLFDPIHSAFGVAINSLVIETDHYYFSNIILALTYALILILVFSLKSTAEKNEIINEKLIADSDGSKQRLLKYQYALLDTAKAYRKLDGEEKKLFELICATLSANLDVNRVSIWELKRDETVLTRKFLFEEDGVTDEKVNLYQSDFPQYFFALKNKPFISADLARAHEDTREFTDSYLIPLDIYSMLDCPIMLNDSAIGVICCENQHQPKYWNPEDGIFLQSLADLISMYKQSEEIKRLLITVQHKNEELAIQTAEIKTINENLESIVQKRTMALEERNKKLVEYGFINSHLVRAPLARIMGLSNLISRDVKVNDHELLTFLNNATDELDRILTKITKVLSEKDVLSADALIKEINRFREIDKDQ